MKILLVSHNIENINTISHILEDSGFEIALSKISDYADKGPEKNDLIVLDISNLDIKNHSDYADFLKVTGKYDVIKLLIMNTNQVEDFLNYGIKFNDVLFLDRLKEEFLPRVRLLLGFEKNIIPKNSLVVSQLILNLDKYELTVNGFAVELTYKEYELLKILLENQNKVFSRNKLLSVVWGYDFYGGSRTVDVHMRRLRSKLGSPYNLMLKTIRNVGYMFSPSEKNEQL